MTVVAHVAHHPRLSPSSFASYILPLTLVVDMSYNREWDFGKDWDRGHAREREDDEYYGDGKRRKYNNGVRMH